MSDIPLDGYGRYRIPDPKTSALQSWTRATTIAKTFDDQHNLNAWRMRCLTAGYAERPDILELAARSPRNQQDAAIQLALTAGGANTAADRGTAMHALTEAADRGLETEAHPDMLADLAAYLTSLDEHNIKIDTKRIEQTILLSGEKERVAGTIDRVVTIPDGRVMIADIKTSENLKWSHVSIAIQLAIYANAQKTWDQETLTFGRPAKNISKTEALVIWLPARQARCELHVVNIERGWALAQLAMTVRAERKPHGLFSAYTSAHTRGTATHREAIRERIAKIGKWGVIEDLARSWPAGIPPLSKSDRHTASDLAKIDKALTKTEREHQLPF